VLANGPRGPGLSSFVQSDGNAQAYRPRADDYAHFLVRKPAHAAIDERRLHRTVRTCVDILLANRGTNRLNRRADVGVLKNVTGLHRYSHGAESVPTGLDADFTYGETFGVLDIVVAGVRGAPND